MADTPSLTPPTLRDVLKRRNYRWLLIGSSLSGLGGSFSAIALVFVALEAGTSLADTGFITATLACAQVMATLWGGVLSDRLPRQVILEGACTALALAHGALALAVVTQHINTSALMMYALVTGCLSALYGPSSASLTPAAVPRELLSDAVTLRRMSATLTSTVGAAAAGVLIGFASAGTAVAVDAAMSALAAAAYAQLRLPNVPAVATQQSLHRSLVDGGREVLQHTWLWSLVLAAFVYHAFFSGIQGVLGPAVTAERFSPAAWGMTLSTLTVASVAGGAVCLRWKPRRPLLVGTASLSLASLFPLGIAYASNPWTLWVTAALHGFSLEIFSVGWEVSLQSNIPPEKLARIYSLDIAGSFAARPLGLATAAPLAGFVGISSWLTLSAGVMAAASLLPLTLASVRNLRR